MEIAALVFSLLVGFFHFSGNADASLDNDGQQMLAESPEQPAAFEAPAAVAVKADRSAGSHAAAKRKRSKPDAPADKSEQALASTGNNMELMQRVADLSAAQPNAAAKTVSQALDVLRTRETTLGDVATLAAAATKAAPGHAPAIAGAMARQLADGRETALAAAVATIVSLVPEQARDIGLVVGAVVGDQPETLAMVAQTVAIAAGEETFSSLAESSGVAVATLMKEGTRIGVRVPFDVPGFAAEQAPAPSMVADGSP